jgi:nitroreductase
MFMAFFPSLIFPIEATPRPDTPPDISLPPPDHRGGVSLEEAIYTRRSVRSFADRPLSLKEVSQLLWAALGQSFIDRAPASIVITADIKRTTSRYGTRGEIRYVPMDTGHAGQNVSLQAQALGLGSVIVGAFNDEAMEKILGKKGETTLYIIPVGREEK